MDGNLFYCKIGWLREIRYKIKGLKLTVFAVFRTSLSVQIYTISGRKLFYFHNLAYLLISFSNEGGNVFGDKKLCGI